jgi:hypothetical protein
MQDLSDGGNSMLQRHLAMRVWSMAWQTLTNLPS